MNKCQTILYYYGMEKQNLKFIEECGELVSAIEKIKQEYTDRVQMLFIYLSKKFNISRSEISKAIKFKLNRTLKRMEYQEFLKNRKFWIEFNNLKPTPFFDKKGLQVYEGDFVWIGYGGFFLVKIIDNKFMLVNGLQKYRELCCHSLEIVACFNVDLTKMSEDRWVDL